jgi:hypothetical protein
VQSCASRSPLLKVIDEKIKIQLHSPGCSLEEKKRGVKTCCLLDGVAENNREIGEKPELQHKQRLAQHNCVNRGRREYRHAERSFIPL